MILSIDGRPHLEQARQVCRLASRCTSTNRSLLRWPMHAASTSWHEKHNVPCFSSSSLRFAPGTQAVFNDPKVGAIMGCDAQSLRDRTPPPRLLLVRDSWRGNTVHDHGPGVRDGDSRADRGHRPGSRRLGDGRIGTFRGHRTGPHTYGATVFGEKRIVEAGKFEGYEPLLVEIVKFFKTGSAPVPAEETLEILAFMEAADKANNWEAGRSDIASLLSNRCE